MPRTLSRNAPTARLSDAALPPLDTASPRWPGRHVDVAGSGIFVRTTPGPADAEPALCVHGLGGAATNWTDLSGQLSELLAVESLDLSGFGYAGPAPDGNYSLQAQANRVIGYIEQSGRGPVHLIGNSMGGAISIIVAAQRPDLMRTLTLISPAVPDVRRFRAHPLRHDPRAALLVVPGLGALAMRQAAGLSVASRVKGTINLCFADPSRYSETRLDQEIEDAEARATMRWTSAAFLRSLRGLAGSQFFRGRHAWAAMSAITAPTLVLWGDQDKLVAPDLADFVAAAIPDSRVLMLSNIGHTAMMEDPVTTARAVVALIEDAEPK